MIKKVERSLVNLEKECCVMDIELIKSPSDGVLKMLQSRSLQKDFFDHQAFDAVGLVQGKLHEMMVAADIAEKAASVIVTEIKGTCPQHFTMLALFGDTSSVNEALNRISQAFSERKKKK